MAKPRKRIRMKERGGAAAEREARGIPHCPRKGSWWNKDKVARPHGMRNRYLKWRQENNHKTKVFVPPHERAKQR